MSHLKRAALHRFKTHIKGLNTDLVSWKPQNMNEWDDISFRITVITLRKARIVSKEGWPLYTLPAPGIAAVEKHRCRSNAFIHYLRINKDKAVRVFTSRHFQPYKRLQSSVMLLWKILKSCESPPHPAVTYCPLNLMWARNKIKQEVRKFPGAEAERQTWK